jgi:hypothetical protein
MIFDAADEILLYWPITGLSEGQDSGHITIRRDTPVAHGVLVAESSSKLKVFGRVGSSGSFIDLALTGINLSALSSGRTSFEIYAHALSPIVGFERVTIAVGSATFSSAGFMA